MGVSNIIAFCGVLLFGPALSEHLRPVASQVAYAPSDNVSVGRSPNQEGRKLSCNPDCADSVCGGVHWTQNGYYDWGPQDTRWACQPDDICCCCESIPSSSEEVCDCGAQRTSPSGNICYCHRCGPGIHTKNCGDHACDTCGAPTFSCNADDGTYWSGCYYFSPTTAAPTDSPTDSPTIDSPTAHPVASPVAAPVASPVAAPVAAAPVAAPVEVMTTIIVEVKTDVYPSEISWTLEGTECGESGYTAKNTITYTECNLPVGSYRFIAQDDYSDGWGTGYYHVYDGNPEDAFVVVSIGPSSVSDSGRSDEVVLIYTQSPSPTTAHPVVSPVCTDVIEGWGDGTGYGDCDFWADNVYCGPSGFYGSNPDYVGTGGLTSDQNCCRCGGGVNSQTDAAYPTTQYTAYPTTAYPVATSAPAVGSESGSGNDPDECGCTNGMGWCSGTELQGCQMGCTTDGCGECGACDDDTDSESSGNAGVCTTHQECIDTGSAYCFDSGFFKTGIWNGEGSCSGSASHCCADEDGDPITQDSVNGCPAASNCDSSDDSGGGIGGLMDNSCLTPEAGILDCEDENLKGMLPSSVFDDVAIIHLDLEANPLLYGTLPEDISKLTNLVYLDVEDTTFYGQIPESLAQMTHIEYLALNNANFCGCVPDVVLTTFDEDIANQQCGTLPRCSEGEPLSDSPCACENAIPDHVVLPDSDSSGNDECTTHQECIDTGGAYCFDSGFFETGIWNGEGLCSGTAAHCCADEDGDPITQDPVNGCPAASYCDNKRDNSNYPDECGCTNGMGWCSGTEPQGCQMGCTTDGCGECGACDDDTDSESSGNGVCTTHQECIDTGSAYCFDSGFFETGIWNGEGSCSGNASHCCADEDGDSITQDSVNGCPAASNCDSSDDSASLQQTSTTRVLPDDGNNSDSGESSTGAIVGGVVGALVLVALLVGAVIVVRRRSSTPSSKTPKRATTTQAPTIVTATVIPPTIVTATAIPQAAASSGNHQPSRSSAPASPSSVKLMMV